MWEIIGVVIKVFTFLAVIAFVVSLVANLSAKEKRESLSNDPGKINIPMYAKPVICNELDGREYNDHIPFSENRGRVVKVWKENNCINLCKPLDVHRYPNIGEEKTIIPIDSIKYFTRDGEYRVDNIVEGGGVSVGGAIVGGVIAGGAGAIIGGRKKVTTTTKEVDKRKTYLYYTENNQDKRIIFISRGYDILLNLIPNKDFGFIEKNKIVESNVNKESNKPKEKNSVYDDIEQLAKLKDKGILTDIEFNEKKKVLLEKIQ